MYVPALLMQRVISPGKCCCVQTLLLRLAASLLLELCTSPGSAECPYYCCMYAVSHTCSRHMFAVVTESICSLPAEVAQTLVPACRSVNTVIIGNEPHADGFMRLMHGAR